MNKRRLGNILLLIGITVFVYVIFYILQPSRFGSLNALYIFFQGGIITAVAACGFYFILAMGLFDFSLGANLILSALVGNTLSIYLGYPGLFIGCIGAGALIGLLNGIIYIKLKIPSIIVTIGLMLIYEASAALIMNSQAIRISQDLLAFGAAPGNMILAGFSFAFAFILISQTRVGIYIRAIGRNELMSSISGINVTKYKVLGFMLCGLFAGICSILTLSYGTALIPQTGMATMSRNFPPIMGCFIGVAFKRYINPVISIIIAEFMINMIISGIITVGLDSMLQPCVIGLVLLFIVVFMARENKDVVVK